MGSDEILARWPAEGAGCALAVGGWPDLAELAQRLCSAGIAPVALNAAILAHVDQPEALAAAEADEPAGDHDQRRAVREALATGYDRWLAAAGADGEPLAVEALELAVAERLDLHRLAELPRPVLLLVPGRTDAGKVRLYAHGRHDGYPLTWPGRATVYDLPAHDRGHEPR
ncbi:MAG: hypothetical protein HYU66_16705 [Armatimonadetes bacterium]|nr:hypothetical protein [Armatimonadota bacterium]